MRKDVENLIGHFEAYMARGGVTPQGISWPNAPDLAARYEILFSGIDFADYSREHPLRLLDLGCGPGFLLDWLDLNHLLDRVDYTGVDITDITTRHARAKWPRHRFELRDVRENPFAADTFDYCMICGIFTARFNNSYEEMVSLATDTLKTVWPSVKTGLAFNAMSKHVDWERDDLFHWPLDEIMSFCKANLSRHVSLRLDYGPWETSAIVTRRPVKRWSQVPAQWLVTGR